MIDSSILLVPPPNRPMLSSWPALESKSFPTSSMPVSSPLLSLLAILSCSPHLVYCTVWHFVVRPQGSLLSVPRAACHLSRSWSLGRFPSLPSWTWGQVLQPFSSKLTTQNYLTKESDIILSVGSSICPPSEDSSAGGEWMWHISSSVCTIVQCPGLPLKYPFTDRGFRAQGFDRKQLVYFSSLQPWLSIWGIFWTTIFILINGFQVFWSFNASDFLTACMHGTVKSLQRTLTLFILDINIPLFVILYFGWKLFKRTKIWKPLEMDFVTVSTLRVTNITSTLRTLPCHFRVFHQSKRLNFQKNHLRMYGRRLLKCSFDWPQSILYATNKGIVVVLVVACTCYQDSVMIYCIGLEDFGVPFRCIYIMYNFTYKLSSRGFRCNMHSVGAHTHTSISLALVPFLSATYIIVWHD